MDSIQHFQSNGKELYVRHDGYINATALCKNAGKLFADWFRLNSTKQFLEELSSVVGIPISSLVQASHGVQTNPQEQGTWTHPDIAPNIGQWLSPSYAVWVAQTIRGIHEKNQHEIPSDLLDLLSLAVTVQKEERDARKRQDKAIAEVSSKLDNTPIAVDGKKAGNIHQMLSRYAKQLGNYSLGYGKFKNHYGLGKYDQLPLYLYDEAVELIKQWQKELDIAQGKQGSLFDDKD